MVATDSGIATVWRGELFVFVQATTRLRLSTAPSRRPPRHSGLSHSASWTFRRACSAPVTNRAIQEFSTIVATNNVSNVSLREVIVSELLAVQTELSMLGEREKVDERITEKQRGRAKQIEEERQEGPSPHVPFTQPSSPIPLTLSVLTYSSRPVPVRRHSRSSPYTICPASDFCCALFFLGPDLAQPGGPTWEKLSMSASDSEILIFPGDSSSASTLLHEELEDLEVPSEIDVTPNLEAKIVEKMGDALAVLQLIRAEELDVLTKWDTGEPSP
ncbi:hypothetical protein LguiA_003270 [Lonicera macranthoides]